MTVDAMAGNDDDGYAASVGALTARSSVRRTSSCLRGRIRLWSSANGDRLILADATVCPSAE
jgi:hypothetical protein